MYWVPLVPFIEVREYFLDDVYDKKLCNHLWSIFSCQISALGEQEGGYQVST